MSTPLQDYDRDRHSEARAGGHHMTHDHRWGEPCSFRQHRPWAVADVRAQWLEHAVPVPRLRMDVAAIVNLRPKKLF